MRTRAVLLLTAAAVLAVSAGCGYIGSGPWRGRVIDAESKEPIEGAVVVAVWEKEIVVLGPSQSYLDAAETLTNKNGEFTIPRTRHVFILMLRHIRSPRFTIFKPGYGCFPRQQTSPTLMPETMFELRQDVVELPRIENREKRLESMQCLEDVMGPGRRQVIPRTYRDINSERISLGFTPFKERPQP